MSTIDSPDNTVERLVHRAQRLYTLPAVALKVIELTSSPRVDIRALKECIENDPALTSKILRVVNSSLFGLTRRVTELQQSLALLGVKPLKLLVLGFSLPKTLVATAEANGLQGYWRHALVKAVAAREIAERLWKQPGDEAFIAGLLHDLGMLVLMQELGASYWQFVDQVRQSDSELAALEQESLGFDHFQLGARLLDDWGLPESIVQAVGTRPERATIAALPPGRQRLAQILHLAELLARMLILERPGTLTRLLECGEAYGRLTVSSLDALVAALDEKVPTLAEILALPAGGANSYQEILTRAHSQLSAVAAAAVADLCEGGGNATGPWVLGPEPMVGGNEPVAGPRSAADRPNGTARRPGTADERGSWKTVAGTVTTRGDLVTQLQNAVDTCRRRRYCISLMLVEVDQYPTLLDQLGPWMGAQSLSHLYQLLVELTTGPIETVVLADFRFAVVLPEFERSQAVTHGRGLVDRVRASTNFPRLTTRPLTISVGLAALPIPPKNFAALDLLSAAERCLSAARLSGGDTVKSIDMF